MNATCNSISEAPEISKLTLALVISCPFPWNLSFFFGHLGKQFPLILSPLNFDLFASVIRCFLARPPIRHFPSFHWAFLFQFQLFGFFFFFLPDLTFKCYNDTSALECPSVCRLVFLSFCLLLTWLSFPCEPNSRETTNWQARFSFGFCLAPQLPFTFTHGN